MPEGKPNLIEKSKCCDKCLWIGYDDSPGYLTEECRNSECPCHTPQPSTPNYIESVLKEFDEQSSGKITDHSFNGSCLYNNNENGKGHKECRYPFNPEIENPQGKQCLKLQEEHFDFKSFLSTALEKQQKQFIEKIEKELKECCGNGKNLSVLGKGVKIGLEKTLSLLKE